MPPEQIYNDAMATPAETLADYDKAIALSNNDSVKSYLKKQKQLLCH